MITNDEAVRLLGLPETAYWIVGQWSDETTNRWGLWVDIDDAQLDPKYVASTFADVVEIAYLVEEGQIN